MIEPQGLTYDERGLIPAIVQDAGSGEVLMLAYMNEESLEKTIASGRTHFWSRSRGRLWAKGETSGHIQEVVEVRLDCDADALLIRVRQRGVACHTGERSCFHRSFARPISLESADGPEGAAPADASPAILDELFEVIRSRRERRRSGSYTTELLDAGRERILKKVGEEASEVIIASMSGDLGEIVYEVSDLLYHLLVLLFAHGLCPGAVYAELARRRRP